MGKEGNLNTDRLDVEQNIASMADWSGWAALTISGEGAPNIVGGYLVVSVKWPGKVVKGIYNASSSAAATVIAQDQAGNEATITINASSFSGKLPAISKIKQAGTSDSLVVFTQDR